MTTAARDRTTPRHELPLARRPRAPPRRAQLRPADGDARARRRRLAVRHRRPPLPRHDVRLLGGQLRPRPPGAGPRADRAGQHAGRHQPRLPHRAARPLPRAALPHDRHGPRPADEHRRRGGRDGDQGGAQVGLQGQGRARRAGARSSSPPATSPAARRRSSASRAKPQYRDGFGPFAPGFVSVPFGDAAALERRSRRTPPRSSSSRSRARPASSCRRPATCARCARSARATTC